jgi:hypothetical protein
MLGLLDIYDGQAEEGLISGNIYIAVIWTASNLSNVNPSNVSYAVAVYVPSSLQWYLLEVDNNSGMTLAQLKTEVLTAKFYTQMTELINSIPGLAGDLVAGTGSGSGGGGGDGGGGGGVTVPSNPGPAPNPITKVCVMGSGNTAVIEPLEVCIGGG